MNPFRALSVCEAVTIAVGVVLCLLYGWTLDDAYIYYRYVDNAVLWGRGLVFNEGEFVEGFSSPLWTLTLLAGRASAAALDALPIGTYWNLQRAIGVGCFLWFAWLSVRVNAILSPSTTAPSERLNLPLIHCALHYSVLSYFSSGMETPLVLVSAASYALYLLDPRSRALGVWIGVTPLVRHELAVAWLLTALFLRWRHGRFHWTPIASGALLGGAYLVFRVIYYADWLPNTFYLKNIWWLSSGLAYVSDTVAAYWLPLIVIAALGAARLRELRDLRKLPHAAEVGMMCVLAAVLAAYVIKIGGDARHFRYLAFSYTLAVLALGGGLLEHLRASRSPRFAIAAAGAVALSTALAYPLQLATHPLPSLVTQTFGAEPSTPERTQRFSQFADAAFHRQPPSWSSRSELERIPPSLPRSEAIRVTSNCWKSYVPYRADYVIHRAGLTDPFIARMQLRFRRPGHPVDEGLAGDLATLRERFGKHGAFRRAVDAGDAPAWVSQNLAALEIVESKAYNSHRLLENFGLALRFVDDLPLASPPRGRR